MGASNVARSMTASSRFATTAGSIDHSDMVNVQHGPDAFPILLYDGLCGFCDGTVQFILRRDPSGAMKFAPLQGATARAVLERNPEVRGVDSFILVERDLEGHELVTVRSEAVSRITRYLGGVWTIAAIGRVIPRPLRDWAYSLFAHWRYRLFGRYDACPVPAARVRARFLP